MFAGLGRKLHEQNDKYVDVTSLLPTCSVKVKVTSVKASCLLLLLFFVGLEQKLQETNDRYTCVSASNKSSLLKPEVKERLLLLWKRELQPHIGFDHVICSKHVYEIQSSDDSQVQMFVRNISCVDFS